MQVGKSGASFDGARSTYDGMKYVTKKCAEELTPQVL